MHPPRRAAVPATFLVCALSAICAPLALTGCASSPKPAVEDERIIGTWRTAGGDATVTFTSTGLYTMTLRDIARPVLGPFEWDQDNNMLTLQTRRESSICGDDPATYRVMLGATTMHPQVERDTCSLREKLFAQPLTKVPAR